MADPKDRIAPGRRACNLCDNGCTACGFMGWHPVRVSTDTLSDIAGACTREDTRVAKRWGTIILDLPDSWPWSLDDTALMLVTWQMGQAMGACTKGHA